MISKSKFLCYVFLLCTPVYLLFFLDAFRVMEYAGVFGLLGLADGFLFLFFVYSIVTDSFS